jgi:integrase
MTVNPRGIFERPKGSGVWWINYFADGRRHREKIGTQLLAIEAYARRKGEILAGTFSPSNIGCPFPRFEHLVADALVYSKQHHAQTTRRNVESRLLDLTDWFRGRIAKSITPKEIDDRLAALTAAGRMPATVNRYRSLLSLIFSLAVKNGKLTANPLRHVPRLHENNERVRFLEDNEEHALRGKIRELCPGRESEFDLALHTGMRQAELYSLRWEGVDLKRRVITILRSKNNRKRHIPINRDAAAAFEALDARRDSYGYVVPLSRKRAWIKGTERIRYFPRWFGDVVAAAKLDDFTFHDLRHTFASRLVMAGVDIRTVQELMGHRSYTMTLRYAHLADAHLRSAIEKISGPSRQVLSIAV